MRLPDLYQAYRKAKQEAWHDRLFCQGEDFARYEARLGLRLSRLLLRLTRDDSWATDMSFWGTPTYYLKSAEPMVEPRGIVRSDPTSGGGLANIEFRRVFRPSIDGHVVGALWVRLVGDMLDAALARSARGNRLYRLKGRLASPGAYHVEAGGIFRSYYDQYTSWRDDALRTAERRLAEGEACTVITLDISRYYESVDAAVFLSRANLSSLLGRALAWPRALWRFHTLFIRGIIAIAQSYTKNAHPLGLPIGLNAAHLLANVALAPLDRRIRALRPLYYGRYVDDLAIVVRRDKGQPQPDTILNRLGTRIDGKWLLNVTPRGRGSYTVKEDKSRVFELTPGSGEDVIRAIRRAAAEITSERRLFPDLSVTGSAEETLLEVTSSEGLATGSLRVGDALTLRRLSVAVTLGRYEEMGRLVQASTWTQRRRRLYRIARSQMLRPDRLVEYSYYLLRLTTFAVAMADFAAARSFVVGLQRSLARLRTFSSERAKMSAFEEVMRDNVRDAILRGVGTQRAQGYYNRVRALLGLLRQSQSPLSDALERSAKEIVAVDMAWQPLRAMIVDSRLEGDLSWLPSGDSLSGLDIARDERIRRNGVEEFVSAAHLPKRIVPRLLFPTRPLTNLEVTYLAREAARDSEMWARFVHALRGVWVAPDRTQDLSETPIIIRNVGYRSHGVAKVAVASWKTTDSQFKAAAKGRPDVSVRRLERLAHLFNMTIRMRGRPRYLVLPELAIPQRWILPAAQILGHHGISLIAGLEYRSDSRGCLVNEAAVCLQDGRLGYVGLSFHAQRKRRPAHGEAEELKNLGKAFAIEPNAPRGIWLHGDHCFGLLVCSELSNVSLVSRYRGKVDSLIIVSWNRDLETYAALVDATSYEVHCSAIFANNRRYGDSRARVPYSERYMRDLIRVRGGLDDYVVGTAVPVRTLRAAHHMRDTQKIFIPLPDGFEVATWRPMI